MKTRLYPEQFRDFCKERDFNEIIYNSSNQPHNKLTPETKWERINFDSLLISDDLHTVFLKHKTGRMAFFNFVFADIDESTPDFGTGITVCCQGGAKKTDQKLMREKHQLIARKIFPKI